MNYLPWALLGLAAYTLVAPLMKVATSAMPSNIAVFISNIILVVAAAVVVFVTDGSVTAYLTHPKAPYAYAAGLALAVGILAYYRALALGPVSVVTPVFGMFIVTSSLIGVVALGESLSVRNVLGIGFAVLAVYLTATG
jgi:transporter family protein